MSALSHRRWAPPVIILALLASLVVAPQTAAAAGSCEHKAIAIKPWKSAAGRLVGQGRGRVSKPCAGANWSYILEIHVRRDYDWGVHARTTSTNRPQGLWLYPSKSASCLPGRHLYRTLMFVRSPGGSAQAMTAAVAIRC
jgi:hypothetical protein